MNAASQMPLPLIPPLLLHFSGFGLDSYYLHEVLLSFCPLLSILHSGTRVLFLYTRSASSISLLKGTQSSPTAWKERPMLLTWPLVSFPQYASNYLSSLKFYTSTAKTNTMFTLVKLCKFIPNTVLTPRLSANYSYSRKYPSPPYSPTAVLLLLSSPA